MRKEIKRGSYDLWTGTAEILSEYGRQELNESYRPLNSNEIRNIQETTRPSL